MTEIQKLTWGGSIDVLIRLTPTDSNQMEITRDYYLSVSRNSYFPLYYPEILHYFKDYLLVPGWSKRSEWWLEFEDVPLKWHVPIGVIYDTLTALDPSKRTTGTIDIWKLNLHYRNYPENEILPLPDYDTLNSHWVNQVKESCVLTNGSAKSIMSLSKADSSELWDGVRQADFRKFWNNFNKVKPTTKNNFKKIPVRVYITAIDKVINLPIFPYHDEEKTKATTVGDSLNTLVPDLFPIDSIPLAVAVLHGVQVPLAASLIELWEEACYVDGFLHFSVILITSDEAKMATN